MSSESSVFEAIKGFRDDQDYKHITQQNMSITQDTHQQGNGASDSPYYMGDFTYPQFMNMQGGLTGNAGTQTAGTAHTHPLNTGASPFVQNYVFPVNTAIGGYIRATSTYVVYQISVGCAMSSASAGGQIMFQIFRESTVDSSLKLVDQGNFKSIVGTAAGARVDFGLNVPFLVMEGERYLVRIVNLTNPAVNMNIVSMQWSGTGSPDTQHKTTTLADATKTSFTDAEALTAANAGVLLPWIAFGVNLYAYPEDKTWWDDFNRVYLGRDWFPIPAAFTTGQLKIVNGQLTYDGTTDGLQGIHYTKPVSGDAMRVDVDMHGINPNGNIDIMICADRELQNYVALAVEEGAALIGTQVNGVNTVRDSYIGASNEATWSLYYEPTPDKYTALKDGQDIGLSWIDSGHVVPHGYVNRYAAIVIECDSGIPGGTCDNFIFRDWTP